MLLSSLLLAVAAFMLGFFAGFLLLAVWISEIGLIPRSLDTSKKDQP